MRNRGTVGGSLCQADPSEDLVGRVRGGQRDRGDPRARAAPATVPVREFHVGPYETVVAPGELLIEIRVPIRPGGGSAYEKVERRAGDWPVAAAGAAVWLDGDVVADVGIGLTAVGAEHFAAPEAEDDAARRGRPPRRTSPRRAGSPRSTATRAPTSAARSTTSGTSPAS